MNSRARTPSAALYELGQAPPSTGSPWLSAEHVEAVVRSYPEHAAAIREAAIALALDHARGALTEQPTPDAPDAAPSPAVAAALARFRAKVEPANPFADLSAKGARDLAKDLGANTLFLLRLRDRQIRRETIPASFMRRLAELLAKPVELLEEHFAGSPVLGAASYKSMVQPAATEAQTFEEAVRTAGLTDQQVRALLAG